MDDFERELKAGFLDEAEQLITDAEQSFLTLEKNPSDAPTLEKIFRLAHNLKGSAKAVGFDELNQFTHQYESVLLKIKKGEIAASPQAVNFMLRALDHVSKMIQALRGDFNAKCPSPELSEAMTRILAGDLSAMGGAEPAPEPAPEPVPEPLPVQAAMPEPSAASVQALAVATETASAPAPQVGVKPAAKPAPAKAAAGASDESVRVSLARLDKLIDYVGELVILESVIREQLTKSATGSSELIRKSLMQLRKVTKEVQDLSMGLRMIPLKQTFQKMQRIVRDTSQILGKQVSFESDGEETELDKTVLESLSDPLVHLIRNAVDHGIESGEARVAAGKPAAGVVRLSAANRAGRLLIEVKDDGGGLDADRLMQKAIEKGVIPASKQLSRKEAYELIFAPGFSTKSQVSEVSGRGVGMDVVKTNIQALNGEIELDSEKGKGTAIRITLPLSLAIIDSIIVRLQSERFIIPMSQVHEFLPLDEKMLRYTTSMGLVLNLRGEVIPVFGLASLLRRSTATESENRHRMLIVSRSGRAPFAVIVDDVLGQQQVVVKKLGPESQSKGFSGSAIMGDGKPAIILELNELAPIQGSVSRSDKAVA